MATYSPKDPEKRLANLRRAKSEGFYSSARIDGKRVDGMTAGIILAVYDGLSAENRAKLIAMPYPRMRAVSFQVAKSGTWTVGASRRKSGMLRTKSRVARRAGAR